MRTLTIIALVVICLVFFNVISIHTIGTLAAIIGVIIAIILGAYFLYRFALGFLALFTTFIGVILVICLITYAATHLI
ncbi:hypothetical protein P9W99_23605 [Bacillus cereus]|uniref:Uncharacterized protein n=2 Tax=Bacillus cereus group TaxID=86661 RepID=A0A9W5QCF4_BACCE|nr:MULTISPECIES: hypothetical protein [Bacillus]AIE37100.1 hypothetical protein BTK_33876 [Bacillus thuringiensis serovar kurstaki str. HD-1]AJK38469.1 putative membrane protein [Bacillus thuringiensis serovar kurstaki]AKJ62982.1 hypothetical protein XI92_33110 [Bacillus thuringiensis]ALL62416.1 hypothetical protein AQ980_31775 [Bacillus thuringiensis]AMX80611.1 hypothetical protein BtBc_29880 [Bacillus thuringiensis]